MVLLIVSAVVMLGIHITMELSRMYLGMHSANQVILGAALGTWTAIIAAFVLQPRFEYYVAQLMDNQPTLNLNKQSLYIFLVLCAQAAISIIIITVLYLTVYSNYQFSEDFQNNLAFCLRKSTFTYKLSPETLDLASYALFPLCVFLGLQFRWRFKRGWSHVLVDNYHTN